MTYIEFAKGYRAVYDGKRWHCKEVIVETFLNHTSAPGYLPFSARVEYLAAQVTKELKLKVVATATDIGDRKPSEPDVIY